MKLDKYSTFKLAHEMTKLMICFDTDYRAQFGINLKFIYNNDTATVLNTFFKLLRLDDKPYFNRTVNKWNEMHTRVYIGRSVDNVIYYNETYDKIELIKKWEDIYFIGNMTLEWFIHQITYWLNENLSSYEVAIELALDGEYRKRCKIEQIKEEIKLMRE